MKKLSGVIRGTIAVAIIVLFAVFFGIRLMKLQIVNGQMYLGLSKSSTTAYQTQILIFSAKKIVNLRVIFSIF